MSMNILVFRTSVQSVEGIIKLKPELDQAVGKGNWNFALDDCDRILRIASSNISAASAQALLTKNGFECSELED